MDYGSEIYSNFDAAKQILLRRCCTFSRCHVKKRAENRKRGGIHFASSFDFDVQFALARRDEKAAFSSSTSLETSWNIGASVTSRASVVSRFDASVEQSLNSFRKIATLMSFFAFFLSFFFYHNSTYPSRQNRNQRGKGFSLIRISPDDLVLLRFETLNLESLSRNRTLKTHVKCISS